MSTCSTEAVPTSNDGESSLDERVIDYGDRRHIYVRRGSQKDSSRTVGKDNLNFSNSHISKQHACFLYDFGSLFIKDCGSTFGTTINDKYITADYWNVLEPGDTIGLIVSKPSSWIAKIVSKFPNKKYIPLQEFSNPSIRLKLRFRFLDGKLIFNIVEDEQSSHDDNSINVNANESYDTDAYYFDDCLEVEKIHPSECAGAERSCTEGYDEITKTCTESNAVESDSKLDFCEYDSKKIECIKCMEDSLLDSKHSDGNAHLDINKPELVNTDKHVLTDTKSEVLGDEKDDSFGHFTSELISSSELVSESDSLSGFSNSDSNPDSSSGSNSSSNSSSSESYDADPELDTSENMEEDSQNEDCGDGNKVCEKIFGFTDSDSQESTICDLSDAYISVLKNDEMCLNDNHSKISLTGNKKKRSFDEYQDGVISSDTEHRSKKARISPKRNNFTFKTLVKEAAKGAFYIVATITALGVYGSTLDSEE